MIVGSTTAILVTAFAIDLIAGDPPNRFHPVAWLGSVVANARRRAPAIGNLKRFMFGSTFLALGVACMAWLGWSLEKLCQQSWVAVAILVQAYALKCTFSVRSLARAGTAVADSLRRGDLAAARREVSYHLVSRDTTTLDASGVSAATIESIAENTSDSIVAPLFYFMLAGLPGAFVYRFVNTCDAMLGYRTAELEWLGKSSARLDDVLNLVPARMTAVLMLVVGGLQSQGKREALTIWRRDHGLTASPNAGHPMSVAAGVLGVSLEKQGQYLLGAGLPPPDVGDIERGIRLLWSTAVAGVLTLGAIQLVKGAVWQ
ncbi:MAG: cobalamin biosynthesis protein [Planctomycetaceae bacterium]